MARTYLRNEGVSQVGPSSGSAAAAPLTQADLNTLLGTGKAAPYIVPRYLSNTPGALTGKAADDPATFRSTEDKYGIALGKERDRIAKEKAAYKEKLNAEIASYQAELEKAEAVRAEAEEAYNRQVILDKTKASNPAWRNAMVSPETSAAVKKAYDDANAAYAAARAKLENFDYDGRFNEYFSGMDSTYQEAVALAQTLRDNTKKQSEFDAAYEKARAAYEGAVTQYDKDRAAYDMYKAEKDQYDKDTAQRKADMEAGKYAVNPYQFLAQGANINEIEELRRQVNAGNLRPNMRVPDELVAPTEVKDPGAFTYEEGMPVRERVEGPKASDAAMGIIGYKPPTEKPKADPELKKVSTAETDTSSVESDYKYAGPLDYQNNEKPKPEQDKSGNPVIPPTTNNLQATSGTSGSSTQATPQTQVTAEPAPALPEQPAGTVGGQEPTTGQDPTTAPAQKPEGEPNPFTPDEEEKEETKDVFQQ